MRWLPAWLKLDLATTSHLDDTTHGRQRHWSREVSTMPRRPSAWVQPPSHSDQPPRPRRGNHIAQRPTKS
ncbi:hypothetical protein AD950_06880 [Gluconobacter oxydans]|nr:hypothetical protein AD950_06880 [Gluconobacter oxydans]